MSRPGIPPEPVENVSDGRVARLELEVERLAGRVERLEAALASSSELEGHPVPFPTAQPDQPAATAAVAERPTLAGILALLGRASLVLGGAFLARAVTESGALPSAIGIGLGLAYAVFWTLVALRTGDPLSATFHGATAALIAFPLIWESVTRFAVLSPRAGAAAIAATAFLLLGVAARRRLPSLAVAGVLGALAADLGLFGSTLAIDPCVGTALALAAATLWLEVARGWEAPRWLAALFASALVGVMAIIATRAGGPPPAYAGLGPRRVLVYASILAALFFAAAVVRVFGLARDIGPFEIVQVPVALAVGIASAASVLRAEGSSTIALGFVAVACGLLATAAAFPLARRGQAENAAAFAWTGLALVVLTAPLALEPPGRALLLCALAVAAAATAGSRTLFGQSAVYLLWAVLAVGLPQAALAAAATHVPVLTPATAAVSAAALLVFLLEMRGGEKAFVPRAFAASLGLLGLGTAAMRVAAVLFGNGAPALSCAGTVILAGSAIGLAALSRIPRFDEQRWLVYAVLVLAGVKLVFVDLSAGRALTLVVGFGAFGVALLTAPRLVRPRSALGLPVSAPVSTGSTGVE
jgi:hypothetical protein